MNLLGEQVVENLHSVQKMDEGLSFIDLSRLTQKLKEDVIVDWQVCLDKNEFVNGPATRGLEKKLAKSLSVEHALACANGTDALILGLQVLGIKPGMRVAVPNLTFWASYEVVVQVGAVPVIVDVDQNDLQLSLESLQEAHSRYNLDCAILVHLMGWASAKLREIREFCRSYGIRLLEDGAQSFGVQVEGKSVFAEADVSTLSFYPAKVVGGAMDGGAVLARNKAAIDLARVLANHGRSAHYSYSHVGWNSRMSELQACYLLRVIDLWPEILLSRETALRIYESLIASEVPEVKLWLPPKTAQGNAYLAVCTLRNLDNYLTGEQVVERLKLGGVCAGRVYPETIDMQPPCQNDYRVENLSVSRNFCRSVFNLPLFYGITEKECERAVSALKKVVRS